MRDQDQTVSPGLPEGVAFVHLYKKFSHILFVLGTVTYACQFVSPPGVGTFNFSLLAECLPEIWPSSTSHSQGPIVRYLKWTRMLHFKNWWHNLMMRFHLAHFRYAKMMVVVTPHPFAIQQLASFMSPGTPHATFGIFTFDFYICKLGLQKINTCLKHSMG